MSAVENLPLIGTRIEIIFKDGEVTVNGVSDTVQPDRHRPWLVQRYERFTVHIVYENGATGTTTVEATPDNRVAFNIEGPNQGDPEDNNWVTLAAVAINARVNENDFSYRLARVIVGGTSFPFGDSQIKVSLLGREPVH